MAINRFASSIFQLSAEGKARISGSDTVKDTKSPRSEVLRVSIAI